MHICFIIDNPLTLLQKTCNFQLTILDQIKHSLQTIIKTLFRNASNSPLQANDMVHLFVTSSTEPLASYTNNHQMHLIHQVCLYVQYIVQVKTMECTIPTFPAEVIESALYHVGRFRCLNESETFLGYRQGTIFQPALIIYLTDNSSPRQIAKIHKKIIQNKLHLRPEYKMVTIKYCSPCPGENNFSFFQRFRGQVEREKESMMMQEVMRMVGGALYRVFSSKELVGLVQKLVQSARASPGMRMGLSNKEYKIHNKEIVKLQFPTSALQNQYTQRLKSLKPPATSYLPLFNSIPSTPFPDLTIDTTPLPRRTQIPLPLQLTPKHLPISKIIIDEFQQLNYFVDFSKEYIGEIDPLVRFLFNTYQLGECQKLADLCEGFTKEKRFPLFYERKKSQFLIGYLRYYPPCPSQPSSSSTTKRPLPPTLPRPSLQLHISFSNFTNLNSNIRSYKQRHPSSQQYFQNYISTLPIFYHKFLKFYLPSLNIVLSPQTELFYENIHGKPIGVTNMRFYEQRLGEKKIVQGEYGGSFQAHEKGQAQCCAVFSEAFEEWEKERGKVYRMQQQGGGFKRERETSTSLQVCTFFAQSITQLTSIKPTLGIYDYFTPQRTKSFSTRSQLQKHGIIRRNDDQMDELVGGLLGNPFKKINKKVKIHDQAESMWVDEGEVEKMKELLDKEMEIYGQMYGQMTQGQIDRMEGVMKLENIYDKLAAVKEVIGEAVRGGGRVEGRVGSSSSKNEYIDNDNNRVNDGLEGRGLLQQHQPSSNGPSNGNYQPQPKQPSSSKIHGQSLPSTQPPFPTRKEPSTSSEKSEKIIQQQSLIPQHHTARQSDTQQFRQSEQQHLQYDEQDSSQSYSSLSEQQPSMVEKILHQPMQSNPKGTLTTANKTPEVLQEVNRKFPIKKAAHVEIPANLLNNELYLKNKTAISEVLINYLGLGNQTK